jgi:FMN phosphatase YigB (HAD superfamily)
MVDVGGTLWPNSWPFRESDAIGRRERIALAMPTLSPEVIDALASELIARSRADDEKRTITTEYEIVVAAEVLIADSLARQGLPAEAETVARLRRAMAIPVSDRMRPLAGAVELLATIHELGMQTVIASNTYWRDAQSYWEDFRALGLAEHVDSIVTSVDAGHLKPHPAVFELARRWAGAESDRCVVIGNSERNDVEPALALGMHAILVHPDDPPPSRTRADAVAPDLWACASVLRDMLESE